MYSSCQNHDLIAILKVLYDFSKTAVYLFLFVDVITKKMQNKYPPQLFNIYNWELVF